MLNIFQSNRVEILADALADAMRASAAASALRAETVVVQSSAMSRWLSFALAERLGITANVRFAFPASYIWSLFGAVLPQVSAQSPFEPEVLGWTFMRVLESDARLRKQTRVARYLNEGDARQRYELARRLAEVYDRYLVYRPDWIAAWSEGKTIGLGADENWQAMLWRAATADPTDHMHAHPRDAFYAAIDQHADARARLPQTLHLFAMQALPPMYLEVIERLAAHVDVRLYALNPCREYWGDIVKRRALARQAATDTQADAYFEVGNSLLASMGAHGRAFFDALAELRAHEVAHYVEPAGDTLLATLQRDVLDLRERGTDAGNAPPLPLAADDASVQVHVCHSAMREVEVLHDRLLDAFARDASLRPGDVLVLVPRIEDYAPAIDAVFATAPAERRMPYAIADLGARRGNTLLSTFFELLALHESRLEAEKVLGLLEQSPIARRFDIAQEELPLLRQWVSESGIRWGRDAAARAALGLPATAEHSWEAGLDRLLLGYAMPGEGHLRHGALLPYDDVEGGAAQALGGLKSFVDALGLLDAALRKPRTLAQWKRLTERLLAQLFEIDEESERDAQAIRSAAATVVANGHRAGFDATVPVEVWRNELEMLLQPAARVTAFFNGGITFAALRPMRPIPARFIAVLDLNDGDFPRNQPGASFDLMTAQPRRGDRMPRDEDRYAMLEALLAAREQLHLSYTGRSERDNSELAPSPLLAELLDAVRRSVVTQQGSDPVARIQIDHPLQAFSRRYFDGSDARLYSYAEDYAAASRAASDTRRNAPRFMGDALPMNGVARGEIDLAALQRFIRSPARHFLQERLGIRLETEDEALDDHEPFTLGGLAYFELCRTALVHRSEGLDAAESLKLVRAAGQLPHGSAGDVLHAGAMKEIAPLHAALVGAGRLHGVQVGLQCGDIRLSGNVEGVGEALRVAAHPGKLKPHHQLVHWVAHLALNAAGHALPTAVHGIDRSAFFAPVSDAMAQLRTLLDLMSQGLCEPLPFFPQTAWAYAKAVAKGKGDPYDAARKEWLGAQKQRGECEDEWFALAFRGRHDPLDAHFADLALTIYGPMMEALRNE